MTDNDPYTAGNIAAVNFIAGGSSLFALACLYAGWTTFGTFLGMFAIPWIATGIFMFAVWFLRRDPVETPF